MTENYEVRIFLSSEINLKTKISISVCEGSCNLKASSDSFSPATPSEFKVAEVYCTCTLYAEGRALCQSLYTGFHDLTQRQPWNENLTFNITYRDLPLSTQAVFTLWKPSPSGPIPLGGTTLPMFSARSRKLRKGVQRLIVWKGVEGSGEEPTTTPGKNHPYDDIIRIDKMKRKFLKGETSKVDWLDKAVNEKINSLSEEVERNLYGSRDILFLIVELPNFEAPVVFKEQKKGEMDGEITPLPEQNSDSKSHNKIVLYQDPEMSTDVNPSEKKNSTIFYSLQRSNEKKFGGVPHDKPNAAMRRQLLKIEKLPPTAHLSQEMLDLIWIYRYFLTSNKKMLTKFLKCVNWSDEKEVAQVSELLNAWEPVDVGDALELFTSSLTHPIVRKYAVDRLSKADDEELGCYLLQLVQALRYEQDSSSHLSDFLISRAVASKYLGNNLYWFLTVETEDKHYKDFFEKKRALFEKTLLEKGFEDRYEALQKQKKLIERLTFIANQVKLVGGSKAVDKLRELLTKPEMEAILPVSLPLNPSIILTSVIPEECFVFRSAMAPLRLAFKSRIETGGDHATTATSYFIFKLGDDPRQDQLVLQIFYLMDRLLREKNLDLKLMTYRVLSLTTNTGLVEFVSNSKTITSILGGADPIRKYLRKIHPDKDGPFEIKSDVLENFLKSCAGYCVMTYILGVGDRHNENLMLTNDGNFFHIDFGFILGNDPKRFAPPFKLSPEMIDAMGGMRSDLYNIKFKTYCCEAYNILRKSAPLILNLFNLMVDANIPQIQGEKSVKNIEDKFRLELSDEEAMKVFQVQIQESASALFAQIHDFQHSLAIKWRKYWE